MKCWDRGFYVRFGGDTIQLAPAFTVEPAQIDALVDVVGEVLAPEALLPRARELAGQLARLPATTLRHTRAVLVRHLRQRMQDELGFGLAHEALAMLCSTQG